MNEFYVLSSLVYNAGLNKDQLYSIVQNAAQIGFLSAVLFELHPYKEYNECYCTKDEDIIIWLEIAYDISV